MANSPRLSLQSTVQQGGFDGSSLPPYSPQQNGIVKRRNGTMVAAARSMLKAKGLPGWFWGEAVNAAVYILNRYRRRAWKEWLRSKPGIGRSRRSIT